MAKNTYAEWGRPISAPSETRSPLDSRPISILLPRLANVRKSGATSWRADCPNGHRKTRGSLSITHATDGTVLLHCFACGDIKGILAHLDLTLADLFPRRFDDFGPEARRRARDEFRRDGWAAALRVLSRESAVVSIAAEILHRGEVLVSEDGNRLALAIQRINDVRQVLA